MAAKTASSHPDSPCLAEGRSLEYHLVRANPSGTSSAAAYLPVNNPCASGA
jgi:hypothetical protein